MYVHTFSEFLHVLKGFFISNNFHLAEQLLYPKHVELESPATWQFTNVFSIHGERNGGVHPFVFALLPNKTQNTYRRLFQALKQLEPALNPTTVMTDFELAAQNAFEEEFPNVQLAGCFFHLSQAIWRQAQQMGLANPTAEQMTRIKMVAALGLLFSLGTGKYLQANTGWAAKRYHVLLCTYPPMRRSTDWNKTLHRVAS